MQPSLFLEHWAHIASQPLFPGFQPAQIPVMVFDGAQTFLFGSSRIPEGFVLADTWAVMPGRFDALTASTAAHGTAMVMATETAEAAIIAAHEAFHVFQAERFPGWGANELDALTYPFHDPIALAARRLETVALHRALSANDPAWLLEALRWRTARFERLSEAHRRYERELERYEGLAFAVELKARGQAHALPLEDFPLLELRRRCYATGQVFASWLERLDPTHIERLEHQYLDELLEQALTGRPLPRPTLEAEISASAHEHARAEVAALAGHRQRQRNEFFDAPFLLELESLRPLWPQGFDPMNLHVLSDTELLHSRYLRLGNDAGFVQALNLASLSCGQSGHQDVHHLTVRLNAAPQRLPANNLVLRADGFKLQFANASLEQFKNRWLVSLK